MKKLLFSFAAFSAVLVSCQKNELAGPQTQTGEMFSLEAGIISTKTVLDITEDGYKVSWDDDDALSVTAGYGNSSSKTYEFTKGEGNTFYCRNVSDPSDITSLDVYYPYTEDAVITVGSAKGGVQTQNGTGSAAHIDGPLYGHAVISEARDAEVQMNHISTLFEINVTNPSDREINVTRIELANSESDPMTGTFDADPETGNLVGKEVSETAVLEIKEGTIAAGQTGKFYITTAPFSLAGGAELTVSVTADGAGCQVVKTMPEAKEFAAGTVNHIYNVSAVSPESMSFAVTPAAAGGIEGYDSSWEDGDAINIFDGSMSHRFGYASGSFSGEAVPSGSYYALFPYDEDAVLENGIIRTEIPSVQTGAMTDLISAGCSSSAEITMTNMTGFLKFTLDEDNVTKVTISGNNNEILAGAVNISWNGGEPRIAAAEGGSYTVSVGDGETVLEKGTYYVNVLPVSLTDYTLTLTYKEDKSSYSGYFDQWQPGMTQSDAPSRQTFTRGVCELPLDRTASVNLTAGTAADLGSVSATLVYYDDAVAATINGVAMTNGSWDNPAPDVASTDNPYSGTNCIKWTMSSKYGEVYFQTWDDDDKYARGALDLTPYRNAHFCLEFAYKAEPGTNFYVRFMEHIAGIENVRIMSDISEYSTGEWELVRIPLDEMVLSNYVWDQQDDKRYSIEIQDGTFDGKGNPFRWDKVLRLIFTFNIDVTDVSMTGKTVWLDDIRIRKVILSDEVSE